MDNFSYPWRVKLRNSMLPLLSDPFLRDFLFWETMFRKRTFYISVFKIPFFWDITLNLEPHCIAFWGGVAQDRDHCIAKTNSCGSSAQLPTQRWREQRRWQWRRQQPVASCLLPPPFCHLVGNCADLSRPSVFTPQAVGDQPNLQH